MEDQKRMMQERAQQYEEYLMTQVYREWGEAIARLEEIRTQNARLQSQGKSYLMTDANGSSSGRDFAIWQECRHFRGDDVGGHRSAGVVVE